MHLVMQSVLIKFENSLYFIETEEMVVTFVY